MTEETPTSQASGRPRTRQRTYKPPPVLDVPDIEENAPERKRVLNVLAQRRYREKKRQRRLRENKGRERERENGISETSAEEPSEEVDIVEVVSSSTTQTPAAGGSSGLDLSLDSWELLNDAALPPLPLDAGRLPRILGEESSGADSLAFSCDGGLTDILSANFGSPSTLDNMSNSSSDMSFPDSYLLPVHELTLLRAMLRIAERIGCKEQLWNLGAISPFNQGIATPTDQLPIAWQPTPSQLLVSHHPLLDFLPWPGVRDRVINIFSLPDTMRPPNATGPLALVNFAYDFEDNSEGVRIYGADPYDPNSWEVGQVFFERWWFLFDRDIIENSNRWRRLRGAPPLALKGA